MQMILAKLTHSFIKWDSKAAAQRELTITEIELHEAKKNLEAHTNYVRLLTERTKRLKKEVQ
jgi:hypothetical protein